MAGTLIDRIMKRALLACALAAAAFGGARAEEVEEMTPFRLAFPEKTQGCFTRAYDRAHLAKNPNQSVASIRLARLKAERKREDGDGPEAPGFAFRLLVRFKDGTAAAESLDCEAFYVDLEKRTPSDKPGYLRCASTCNRGFVDVTPEGADRVKLTLGGDAMGKFVPDAIGVGRSCESDRGMTWLGDREGDRVFLLDRAGLEACR